MRPLDSVMAAGSERGLKMMLKKNDGVYEMNKRVKGKTHVLDSCVQSYVRMFSI